VLFLQNFIKLSAAVREELSCQERNKKTIELTDDVVATAHTVKQVRGLDLYKLFKHDRACSELLFYRNVRSSLAVVTRSWRTQHDVLNANLQHDPKSVS